MERMTRAAMILLALLAAGLPASAQVGHWTPASEPGTQVYATTLDGAAWFASSATGGMRSTDRGATWVPLPFEIARVAQSAGTGNVFVGTAKSGLYYSSDAGATWSRAAAPPSFYQTSDLAPVGAQPGLLYATSGFSDGISGLQVPQSVVRSRDGGASWQALNDAEFFDTLVCVAPSPVKPSLVFVGNLNGIYRSRDGGDTWQKVRSASIAPVWPWGNRVVADARDSRVVYAVTAGEVWVSEDEGDTWRQGATLHVSKGWLRLVADPASARRLWVVAPDGMAFETRDAARTWSQHTMSGETTLGWSYQQPAISVVAEGPSRRLVSGGAGRSYSLDVSSQRLVLGPDLWWNPQQPGWGLSLIQHPSGQMFAIWFTYTAEGKPTWLYMPGGAWSDANTFVATLYKASGTPYGRTWRPAEFSYQNVGFAQLHFDDRNNGFASFVLHSGTRVETPIARMMYGPVPPSVDAWSGTGDLFYNPSESGWGISFHQQFKTTFGTWFTFDAASEPTWFVMPNGMADVYRATARPGAAYSPAGVTVERVGTAWTTTVPEARFNFTIDGFTFWSRLERLPF
jgi:photosystem II stability/assembly factor-like uncharacterized protein